MVGNQYSLKIIKGLLVHTEEDDGSVALDLLLSIYMGQSFLSTVSFLRSMFSKKSRVSGGGLVKMTVALIILGTAPQSIALIFGSSHRPLSADTIFITNSFATSFGHTNLNRPLSISQTSNLMFGSAVAFKGFKTLF